MASYIEIDDIDDIVEESLHDFLKRKNLEKYLPQFQEQGADVIQDVLESVDKDLCNRYDIVDDSLSGTS